MGSAGTGTVVNFGILQHTATRTRGIAGMHGYYYHKVSIIFVVLKVVFSHIFSGKFIVSHCDTTKYGCQPCTSLLLTINPLSSPYSYTHPTSKNLVSHIFIYQKLISCSYLG